MLFIGFTTREDILCTQLTEPLMELTSSPIEPGTSQTPQGNWEVGIVEIVDLLWIRAIPKTKGRKMDPTQVIGRQSLPE